MTNVLTSPAKLPGFTSCVVHANSIRLHCLIGGYSDGTPILLWHGFLGTSYTWRKVAPLLADQGYAVLVPDIKSG